MIDVVFVIANVGSEHPIATSLRWTPLDVLFAPAYTIGPSVAAIFIAVATLGGSATAQELRLELAGSNAYHYDDSYDVFSPTDRAGYGNYALGVRILDHLGLLAEYTFGSETETLFGDMDSDFTIHALQLGVEGSYDVFSFLRPIARAELGFMWGDIDLDVGNTMYDDTAFGLSLTLLGGLDVLGCWAGGSGGLDGGMGGVVGWVKGVSLAGAGRRRGENVWAAPGGSMDIRRI